MLVTFDIETLPTADESIIAEIASTITAPAQYKKPESIAEWMEANKEAAVKEKVSKTSFDGLYGRIACIAYAFNDGDVFHVDTISAGSELAMLERFYGHLTAELTTTPYHGGSAEMDATFVGHNIAGFDLPFLKHRSIVLGIKPPSMLLKAMNAKPWDKCIADTMLMWSPDRAKRVSMDKLCRILGIPGNGDFDGSMVAETWPADHQKVIDYCKDDVERTRAIYSRLTFADHVMRKADALKKAA